MGGGVQQEKPRNGIVFRIMVNTVFVVAAVLLLSKIEY
jgi:hypothetical protein